MIWYKKFDVRVHCVQELLESEFDAVLSSSQTQLSKVLNDLLSDTDTRSCDSHADMQTPT